MDLQHLQRRPLSSPDHIHGMLLSRSWGERSESHHLSWVPEGLLQVAPLNVALEVGQTQHGQVQRVRSDSRQARPLLLCPHNPVVKRVGVMLVVLQVISRGVRIRDCVGLNKKKSSEVSIGDPSKLRETFKICKL